jgi:hypothetical protein
MKNAIKSFGRKSLDILHMLLNKYLTTDLQNKDMEIRVRLDSSFKRAV